MHHFRVIRHTVAVTTTKTTTKISWFLLLQSKEIITTTTTAIKTITIYLYKEQQKQQTTILHTFVANRVSCMTSSVRKNCKRKPFSSSLFFSFNGKKVQYYRHMQRNKLLLLYIAFTFTLTLIQGKTKLIKRKT